MTIPRTMKAAILVEQKKPLVIDDIQLPNTLEVGQVLVKVHFSGICGSQIGEIDGAKGPDKFLPHLLGHEGDMGHYAYYREATPSEVKAHEDREASRKH